MIKLPRISIFSFFHWCNFSKTFIAIRVYCLLLLLRPPKPTAKHHLTVINKSAHIATGLFCSTAVRNQKACNKSGITIMYGFFLCINKFLKSCWSNRLDFFFCTLAEVLNDTPRYTSILMQTSPQCSKTQSFQLIYKYPLATSNMFKQPKPHTKTAESRIMTHLLNTEQSSVTVSDFSKSEVSHWDVYRVTCL
jgi:hypothetical protein